MKADNRFFKMGAVAAIGEMYDAGLLGNGEGTTREVRLMLQGYGISGLDDMKSLGMMGPYLANFEKVYS